FNLKHFKLVKELKNIKPQLNWLSFSNNYSKSKKELLNSIIADNKFVEEDLKIRAMVEEMLVKEFSEDIKNIKSYNFLVDSVVNKLKQKQIDETSDSSLFELD
ncbi:MAG: hypothetical protein LUH11_03845, partial [Candidatus Gastranaerophilales bacterium]|nr:hypothetical protein [Candidatus Gastranaerophilales bacterium]